MSGKLFCEMNPVFYEISVLKCRAIRHLRNLLSREHFAAVRQEEPLPFLVYEHASLIRRKLGSVDMRLQENKAVNLALSAPKVNGILIRPGETFSFWRLVGKTSRRKGYREGLVISRGKTNQGIGGGLCQFSNLIHWMVLHSPLEVTELHHHDRFDLFPDHNRKVPFGTGTSIMYNYLDYRFINRTEQTFQLLVWTDNEYLRGQLRCEYPPANLYDIVCEDEHFTREGQSVYRSNRIYQEIRDRAGKQLLSRRLLRENHAEVLYEIRLPDEPS